MREGRKGRESYEYGLKWEHWRGRKEEWERGWEDESMRTV